LNISEISRKEAIQKPLQLETVSAHWVFAWSKIANRLSGARFLFKVRKSIGPIRSGPDDSQISCCGRSRPMADF
jgi:hypothetical protein